MKKSLLLSIGLFGARALFAQGPAAADSTGLPGDNFSLQGALELFSKAKDLESFEKALNTSANKVNNLDLDGDGNVDYIRVVDVAKGDVHAIVLRVPVNKDEQQDVAVIELEKTGDKSARALIRGDAVLYGDSVLLEPVAEVMQTKGSGPDMGEAYPVYVWVNVWGWPSVQWMYSPYYSYWDSPWSWGYYPRWYSPWRPWGWRSWWGYSYHYNNWCRPVHHYDNYYHSTASTVYAPRRSMSARVVENTRPVREARAATGSRAPQLRSDNNAARSNTRQAAVPERTVDRSQRPVSRVQREQGAQRSEGVRTAPDAATRGTDRSTPATRGNATEARPSTRPAARESSTQQQRSATRPITREGGNARPQAAPRQEQRAAPARQAPATRQAPQPQQRNMQRSAPAPSRGGVAPGRSAPAPSRSAPAPARSAPSRGR